MQRPTLTRRQFSTTAAAALITAAARTSFGTPTRLINVAVFDRARILSAATSFLSAQPITVTAFHSPRSPGTPHDFFSEGDYWWPDPANPTGPYIRRDGLTNPANFTAHREAMVRLSIHVATLTAAWKITRNPAQRARFSAKAAAHLRAWFVTEATRMSPNLQHAQGITGVNTGRGIGIIDTIHLVEVARSADLLEQGHALDAPTATAIRQWFAQYLTWLTASKNGIEERDQKNNHGSCWLLQVAEFATYLRLPAQIEFCSDRFRTALVPTQIALDGSLPLELARTKPFSYALFDLDILATLCQILSTPANDLWAFTTPDGRGIKSAVAYMVPFIADKSRWPLKPDVEFFDALPVRQPSLLFAGLAYRNPAWIALWRRLNPDPTVGEIIRNFPIRQTVLWV